MNSQKIEEDVRSIVENYSATDFIYDFLIAFGFTKMTIKRLREGNSNLAQKDNQLIIKQKLFYEYSSDGDIYSIIDDLKNDSATYTHKPRFIIVNNDKELLAIDTKTQETLAVELNELYKNIDFFMSWTGKEKYVAHQENPADVKAAEKMANIYDEIVKLNPNLTEKDNSHSLNIFLTRLLFCFFAEDTGIFKDNIFTKTIVNHTNEDGSDLADILGMLFESLDKKDSEKGGYPSFIQEFPYVNGKLFTAKVDIPKLNAKVRKLMIDCGNQDWKEINPDIFGSMFQAVSVAEVRSGLGQHYTSVPNIMKVIEPLFLNDLREEYEKADSEKKLRKLLDRIYNLKIFDPACGSGNFLIIAYKQLRLLEMDIIQKITEVTGKQQLMLSQIQLSQFYGIEIDDFACEIATLSLWLAEHQMNRKFKELFGDCKPALPLSKSGNIVCGNATRLDWEKVCPKGIKGFTHKEMEQMTLVELEKYKQLELQGSDNEIYILGNPPYAGAKIQNDEQRNDLIYISHCTSTKSLNIVKLDKSLKAVGDFYFMCNRNPNINGIGFSLEHEFPIDRKDFFEHLTNDIIRDLGVHTEYKSLTIVKPVTKRTSKGKWTLSETGANEEQNYTMEDEVFKEKTLNGDFVKQNPEDDEILALTEYNVEYKNGIKSVKDRKVIEIYEFNKKKFENRDLPENFELNRAKKKEINDGQLNLFDQLKNEGDNNA